MRALLLIAALVVLVLLVRAWRRQSGGVRLRWVFYIALAAIVALAAAGKLHWIVAAATAVVGVLPLLAKKLFLLWRYLPLLGGFISRAGYGKPNNARFESAWLRLEINPALGTVDGEVLQGEFKGQRLSALSASELKQLHEVLRDQDLRSAMLLKSYIAFKQRRAYHADEDGGIQQVKERMSHAEALSILGLKEAASQEDIVRAHRRLIQKIHPDRGGSSYLAAKINQAKDTLLKP